MNKVEETNDGKIYIDGVEIANIKSIKRFFDLAGCGVEISFYTRNYIIPNGKSKMTKQQAEKAIMQILKQYEIDNKTTIDSIDLSEVGIIKRLLYIKDKSLTGSNWDV